MVAIACKGVLRAASARPTTVGPRPRMPMLPARRPVAVRATSFNQEVQEVFLTVVDRIEAVEDTTVQTILHTPLACIPIAVVLVVAGPKAFEWLSKKVGGPLVGVLLAWLVLAHPTTLINSLYNIEGVLEHQPVAVSVLILSIASLLIGPYLAMGAGTLAITSILGGIAVEKGWEAEHSAPLGRPLRTIQADWVKANTEAQARGVVPPPTLPAPDLAAIKIPDVKIPEVPLPAIPDVKIPDVKIPDVRLPVPALPAAALPPAPSLPNLSWPSFSAPSFSLPAMPSFATSATMIPPQPEPKVETAATQQAVSAPAPSAPTSQPISVTPVAAPATPPPAAQEVVRGAPEPSAPEPAATGQVSDAPDPLQQPREVERLFEAQAEATRKLEEPRIYQAPKQEQQRPDIVDVSYEAPSASEELQVAASGTDDVSSSAAPSAPVADLIADGSSAVAVTEERAADSEPAAFFASAPAPAEAEAEEPAAFVAAAVEAVEEEVAPAAAQALPEAAVSEYSVAEAVSEAPAAPAIEDEEQYIPRVSEIYAAAELPEDAP